MHKTSASKQASKQLAKQVSELTVTAQWLHQIMLHRSTKERRVSPAQSPDSMILGVQRHILKVLGLPLIVKHYQPYECRPLRRPKEYPTQPTTDPPPIPGIPFLMIPMIPLLYSTWLQVALSLYPHLLRLSHSFVDCFSEVVDVMGV